MLVVTPVPLLPQGLGAISEVIPRAKKRFYLLGPVKNETLAPVCLPNREVDVCGKRPPWIMEPPGYRCTYS